MKNIFFNSILAACLLTACGGNVDSYTPPANTQAAPVIAPKDQATSVITPVQQSPFSNPAAAQPITTTPQNVPAAATITKGLNPAHGQPGHRCDIAVGAPLDSPPQTQAVTAQPAGNNKPTVVTPVPNAPQKIVTAAGMNPPHGEPNHRCDIAVGAPLSSAPVQPKIEPVKKDSGS